MDSTATSTRRHDLDALRAVAMLLGIALHAALSFMPGPWMVRDTQTNELFGLFVGAVHGFRMPLFFLISGFFTAMLWRRRGLKALLAQRAKRILLPCVIGVFTVVPVMWLTIALVSGTGGRTRSAAVPSGDGGGIWLAAVLGDIGTIERQLTDGADINGLHPEWGATALSLAALYDQTAVVRLLIERGADVNAKGRDGGRPLHAAAFLGRAGSVELLLENGADTTVRNESGQTPAMVLSTDWRTTQFIASMIRLKLNRAEVEAGRAEAAGLFRKRGVEVSPLTATGQSSRSGAAGRVITLLMFIPVFHHLWFLWILCWLVAGFALIAWTADKLKWRVPVTWMTRSPACYLWLIPLTMIPQWFMGRLFHAFGPDTSIGLLPMPHVLIYYAIFFGFGALYYDSNDDTGRVGKRWPVTLPIMLLVVFPLGLEMSTGSLGFRERLVPADWWRPLSVALQVTYAWAMSFAFMGLFRRMLSGESRAMRYVSDSSYWLYLAHLPLVILAQGVVRSWPLPASVKFVLVCVVVTGFLLLTYQFMVRYTWIGRLLNGPRQRPGSPP